MRRPHFTIDASLLVVAAFIAASMNGENCEPHHLALYPTQVTLTTPAPSNVAISVGTAMGIPCVWMPQPTVPWITVSPTSGMGSGLVIAMVQANLGTSDRTGTVAFGGDQVVRITQPGARPCPDSALIVFPRDFASDRGRQDAPLDVVTLYDCQWAVQPDVSWLVVRPDESFGFASRRIHYSVLPNTSSMTRQGTLRFTSGIGTVIEQGCCGRCSFSIKDGLFAVPATGGRKTLQFRTDAWCVWRGSSTDGYLSVSSSPMQGTDVEMTFDVGPNGGEPREGEVILTGPSTERQTVYVQQEGTDCVTALRTTLVEGEGGMNSFPASGGESAPVIVELAREACPLPVRASPGIDLLTVALTAAPPTYSVTAKFLTNFDYSPVARAMVVAGRLFRFRQEAQTPPITATNDGPCVINFFGRATPSLHAFRDEVLDKTPRGRARVRDYYDFAPEVVRLVLQDAALRQRVWDALRRYEPVVSEIVSARRARGDGEVAIDESDFAEIDALLTAIGAAGSPELRGAVVRFRRELRDPSALRELGVERRPRCVAR